MDSPENMRLKTSPQNPARSYSMKIRKWIVLSGLLLLLPVPAFASPEQEEDGEAPNSMEKLAPRQKIFFHLQSFEPGSAEKTAIQSFAKNYFSRDARAVIQGYSCDTLGPGRSYFLARKRARALHHLLLGVGISPDRIAIATERVVDGEPRTLHRKATVEIYYSNDEFKEALRQANSEAAMDLKHWKKDGFDGRPIDDAGNKLPALTIQKGTEVPGGTTPIEVQTFLFVFAGAMVLILLVMVLDQTLRFPPVVRYLHSSRGAWLKQIIQGTPFFSRSLPGVDQVRFKRTLPSHNPEDEGEEVLLEDDEDPAHLSPGERTSRGIMEQSKRAPAPEDLQINLKAFIHPDYKNSSLKELRSSPTDAIAGITRRQAMMLEEGFNIRTVEDLAGMKHVEIARAIIALNDFEKDRPSRK